MGIPFTPEDEGRTTIYHTYEESGGIANRIVEIERNEDTWDEVSVLIDEIPGAMKHNGGRLAIGPDDNRMFSTEHGPTANDEVNEIEAGNHYGWPVIVGDEEEEGMETAVLNSGDDTWAPSGAAFKGEDEGRWRDVAYDESEAMLYMITNNTDGLGKPYR
ncbi:hypothetical protein DH09_18155 [Bacillaceae bacterium JMAK1]|nr:hypothetical protein DH09_18155 [Bacillaceae bacterium JMAK1]